MRKKVIQITFPFILIANLLFSQIVVNLLHDRHDFHEPIVELQKGASIQKHGEHCKICSLDILFNLLVNPSTKINALPVKDTLIVPLVVDVRTTLISFSQDRAPPVLT